MSSWIRNLYPMVRRTYMLWKSIAEHSSRNAPSYENIMRHRIIKGSITSPNLGVSFVFSDFWKNLTISGTIFSLRFLTSELVALSSPKFTSLVLGKSSYFRRERFPVGVWCVEGPYWKLVQNFVFHFKNRNLQSPDWSSLDFLRHQSKLRSVFVL